MWGCNTEVKKKKRKHNLFAALLRAVADVRHWRSLRSSHVFFLSFSLRPPTLPHSPLVFDATRATVRFRPSLSALIALDVECLQRLTWDYAPRFFMTGTSVRYRCAGTTSADGWTTQSALSQCVIISLNVSFSQIPVFQFVASNTNVWSTSLLSWRKPS